VEDDNHGQQPTGGAPWGEGLTLLLQTRLPQKEQSQHHPRFSATDSSKVGRAKTSLDNVEEDLLLGHQADISHCHLGASISGGHSHCTVGPSPTRTYFKRAVPHHPLRLSVGRGHSSESPSPGVAPHHHLRPSVSWGIPHPPLHQRRPPTITSGPL